MLDKINYFHISLAFEYRVLSTASVEDNKETFPALKMVFVLGLQDSLLVML